MIFVVILHLLGLLSINVAIFYFDDENLNIHFLIHQIRVGNGLC